MTELPKSSAITRLCDRVAMDGGILGALRTAATRSVVDGWTTPVRDKFSGRFGEVRTQLAETLLSPPHVKH